MWLLPWLAAAVATVTFEPITLVAAGRPLALLRTDEGQGLTVSASCRTRAGTLACQAVSALTSASRRSPEGARRGIGGFDCTDFHATTVEVQGAPPLCRLVTRQSALKARPSAFAIPAGVR